VQIPEAGSLVGVTDLRVLGEGIPDEAFVPFIGDDPLSGAVNVNGTDSHRAMTKGGGPSGAVVAEPPLGSTDAPAGGASGIAASVIGDHLLAQMTPSTSTTNTGLK